MRTILLKSAYDRLTLLYADPARMLEALNAYLVDEFPDGDLHCTACCLDLVFGADFVDVVYANGGNPPLFVFSPGGAFREVYAGGPLLGAEHLDWPAPESFRLEPGELMLVCSDGLSEQPNSERARFDTELPTLRLDGDPSAAAAVSILTSAFEAFRGDRSVSDDITLIAVRALTAAELG
jgi:serine phosphatase RsbU (regulator of sigma subunit)